jgi:hypothetical protein
MAPAAASLADLPPVVRTFVQTHRLPAGCVRSGGRAVVVIDRRHRIHLHPAPYDRVALEAEVMALPERNAKRIDEILPALCMKAAGLLVEHGSTLAIDRERNSLVLQQCVGRLAQLRELEDALADFANALGFWREICARDAAQTPGVALA